MTRRTLMVFVVVRSKNAVVFDVHSHIASIGETNSNSEVTVVDKDAMASIDCEMYNGFMPLFHDEASPFRIIGIGVDLPDFAGVDTAIGIDLEVDEFVVLSECGAKRE